MSDAPINAGHGLPVGPKAVDGLKPGAPEAKRAQGEDSVAFKALLEQLEQRADDLRRASSEELEPAHLSGAVEQARASLEEALSLGDELLEAYRQRTHQQETEGGGSAP